MLYTEDIILFFPHLATHLRLFTCFIVYNTKILKHYPQILLHMASMFLQTYRAKLSLFV